MHRTRDGFRNPWPGSEAPGWREVLRVVAEFFSRRQPLPPRGSFPAAAPEIARPRGVPGPDTATWIGHSTVLLQLGAVNVLTDPVFSARAFPVQWLGPQRIMDPALTIEELPEIDVVLISHNHYDHLDRPAVQRIARANPRATWVLPLGLGNTIRPWGAERIVELDWWQDASVCGLRITATPARHMSARGLFDRGRTLWCGFAIESEVARVYFAGDSGYHPEFAAIGQRCRPFDLVMLPIGAYDPRWIMERVHMNPEEAVRAYQDVAGAHPGHAAPLMLAIHWGTFRLTLEPMDEPPRRAARRWQEVGLDTSRLWIARFGETRHLSSWTTATHSAR